MTAKTPGEVLTRHLDEAGISQSQLAEELAVHHTTVNKMIKNRRRPSLETFGEMGVILGPVFVLEYVEAIHNGDPHLFDRTPAARSADALDQPALSEQQNGARERQKGPG
jgi:DNA-binding XRE family transcriptional regulator